MMPDDAWKEVYYRYTKLNVPAISVKTLFNLSFVEFKAFWGAFAELIRHARDKFSTPITMDMYDVCPKPSDKECPYSPHGEHELYDACAPAFPDYHCIFCGKKFIKTPKTPEQAEELFLAAYKDRADVANRQRSTNGTTSS